MSFVLKFTLVCATSVKFWVPGSGNVGKNQNKLKPRQKIAQHPKMSRSQLPNIMGAPRYPAYQTCLLLCMERSGLKIWSCGQLNKIHSSSLEFLPILAGMYSVYMGSSL